MVVAKSKMASQNAHQPDNKEKRRNIGVVLVDPVANGQDTDKSRDANEDDIHESAPEEPETHNRKQTQCNAS